MSMDPRSPGSTALTIAVLVFIHWRPDMKAWFTLPAFMFMVAPMATNHMSTSASDCYDLLGQPLNVCLDRHVQFENAVVHELAILSTCYKATILLYISLYHWDIIERGQQAN